MELDIILSGVGGQGILSIAAVIGQAVLNNGLNIKQAEVHGMSQRGGDVQSNLRISSEKIDSDLISKGGADIVISLEPMEALRYKQYLKPCGYLVTNSVPVVNIPTYPDIEKVYGEISAMKNAIMIDLDKIATEIGAAKATNMVLLGAASHFLQIDFSLLEEGVKAIFARKGEDIVGVNLLALREGRNAAKLQLKNK
ncbi:MAG: indolepyruvate oxidoreductase subunit beta [Rikenellaceae bacterium]